MSLSKRMNQVVKSIEDNSKAKKCFRKERGSEALKSPTLLQTASNLARPSSAPTSSSDVYQV